MKKGQMVLLANCQSVGGEFTAPAVITKDQGQTFNVTVFPDLGNPFPVSSVKSFDGTEEELTALLETKEAFGRQEMFLIEVPRPKKDK